MSNQYVGDWRQKYEAHIDKDTERTCTGSHERCQNGRHARPFEHDFEPADMCKKCRNVESKISLGDRSGKLEAVDCQT